MTDFYRQALFAARGEYQKLLAKRQELDAKRVQIENELTRLLQTISGLAVLAKEKVPGGLDGIKAEDLADLGLADACRVILRSEDRFMSPRLIRGVLADRGYDLSVYSNPLASIHSILKRFEQSGEVESLKMGGKVGYRFKPAVDDAVLGATPIKRQNKKR